MGRLWGSPPPCPQAMRRGNFHEGKKGPRVVAGPLRTAPQHRGSAALAAASWGLPGECRALCEENDPRDRERA